MLSAAGVRPDEITFRYGLDARYLGQGNEITLWVGEGAAWPATDEQVVAQFEIDYRRIYGLTIPDVGIEAVTWRLSAFASAEPVEPKAFVGTGTGSPRTTRTVRFSRATGAVDTPVYRRSDARRRPGGRRPGDRRGARDDGGDPPGLDDDRRRRRVPHRRLEGTAMTDTFDPIELEVLWQSLIATVNEQARALQRAAFSPIVREAGDLANAVFDRRGRMVAQAVTGTPGHINSLARAAWRDPRRVPDRHAGRGRRADHQRPVQDGGPAARRHRAVPGVPRAAG